MKKDHKRMAIKVIKIICVIISCVGIFCLLGFIGNVDYCTETGTECNITLSHLIISTVVFISGIIAYRIAAKAEELI